MLSSNGWTLTGNKIWGGNSWEAKHTCGNLTGFGSKRLFLENNKKCHKCQWNNPQISDALGYHYGIYKWAANKRSIGFYLSEREFESIVVQPCYYCGEGQTIKYRTKSFELNGIDRIDNLGGYVLGNVRPCCRICNVAKGSMTEKEFIEKVTAWSKRLVK